MQGEQARLDGYVTSSAEAFRIVIEPEWTASIIANLEAIFKIAASMGGFELPYDIEPAELCDARKSRLDDCSCAPLS